MRERSIYRERRVGWLAEMCDAIVSIFFPADCRICEELLTRASRVPICGECLASFVPVGEKVCEICGRPMLPVTSSVTSAEGAKQLCPICREQPGQEKRIYAFDRGAATPSTTVRSCARYSC